MGADTKTLRTRMKSVDSTLHLTRAMGLVASSKVRRATDAMLKGRSYADAVSAMTDLLAACPECHKSPYMSERKSNRTRIIVVAGDRGLCGGYNVNIFRMLRELPADIQLLPLGKRACDQCGAKQVSSEHFTYAAAKAMAEEQCRAFRAGAFDRLGILATRYVSVMKQQPTLTWILPLTPKIETGTRSVLFEPNEEEILEAAVPEYVAGTIYAWVRESFACEVMARRMAMDSAGKNAGEMIEKLQLQYNQARQSAITQEITEIVAGAGDAE